MTIVILCRIPKKTNRFLPFCYKLIHSFVNAYALPSTVLGMRMNQFVNTEFLVAFTRQDKAMSV